MNSSTRSSKFHVFCLLACSGLLYSWTAGTLHAQPGRFGNRPEDGNNRRGPSIQQGSFGNRGGFNSGVTGSIFRDESKAELGLDDATMQKVQAAMEQSRGNSDEMREMFDRSRNAQTDEEREKIREEMTKAFQERNKKTEEEIGKIIGDEKMARLRQLSLQYAGAYALQQEEVANDLKISDDQKAKIESLMEERNNARRELGFNASPEDRAKFDKEWNSKVFGILNEEQRKVWTDKVGGVIVDTGVPGNRTERHKIMLRSHLSI